MRDHFPKLRDDQPLDQAVAGTDRERDALLPALGAEIFERAQMLARQLREAFALLGQLENFSAPLRDFAAEELGELTELPAVLALANRSPGAACAMLPASRTSIRTLSRSSESPR